MGGLTNRIRYALANPFRDDRAIDPMRELADLLFEVGLEREASGGAVTFTGRDPIISSPLFPGSVAYIWHAGTKAGIVQDSLAACGFETRSQIIWAKNNFAIGRGHDHCKHEPCWYVVRKGSTASWVGDHSQTTLWQIDKNLKRDTRPEADPKRCVARLKAIR
jgi:hypothetical protein